MQVSTSVGIGGNSVIPAYLNTYSKEINKSLENLASGLRVKTPSESPGDFFKAQALQRRASENNLLQRDMETHLSRIKTVDGYLDTVETMLDDMSSLAKEASNEADDDLRGSMAEEYDAKWEALQTFINSARYEGEAILTGAYDLSASGTALSVQIDEGSTDTYSYEILDTTIDATTGLDIGDYGDATTDWATANDALNYYTALTEEDRGVTRLNRNAYRIQTHTHILEGAQNSLKNKNANYEAASSALVGVDDAEETTRLSALQIRQQAAASFLAQNNLAKGNVIGTLTNQSFNSFR